MKKLFVVMVVLVTLVSGLFASGASEATAESKSVTLKVMTWQYADEEVAALNETIEVFNQKYPEITIDLVPVQDYQTEYKLAFDGGNGPDVVYVDDLMQLTLEQYDYLMDITTYVKENNWEAVANPGIVDYQNQRHPGVYTSVAQNNNPRVMWYNKAIFEAVGVSIPETLDELDAVCEKIKAAGYTPFEADPITMLWIMDELVTDYVPYEDVREWYYLESNSDAMKAGWLKAAQKVDEWVKKGYFRPEILSLDTTSAFVQFLGGTDSAMFYCSADISNYFGQVGATFGGAFRFPTLNSGEVKTIVSGAHGGWAVNAAIDPDKLDAAIKFLGIFYTKEVNDIWVNHGYFSALTFDISDTTTDEFYKAAADATHNTRTGFFLDNSVPGLLETMWVLNQQLIMGEITPEQYAEKINVEYESLKAEYIANNS